MTTEHSADKTVFERRESEARSYCRNFDTVFASASGSHMTDEDGKTYIDFLAGCSSLNYGHNDPDMKKALIDHIERDGIAHGLDMYTDAKAEWLKAFEDYILEPRGMGEPCAADRDETIGGELIFQTGIFLRKDVKEIFGAHIRPRFAEGHRRQGAGFQRARLWSMGKVHADADGQMIAHTFKQDTRNLAASQEHIVRPF